MFVQRMIRGSEIDERNGFAAIEHCRGNPSLVRISGQLRSDLLPDQLAVNCA